MLAKLLKKKELDFDNPDFKLGGGWGCHISLCDHDNFNINNKRTRVYGHQPLLIGSKLPKKGKTLLIEGNKSLMLFEFVKVEWCNDPNDMFFADVKPIGQQLK